MYRRILAAAGVLALSLPATAALAASPDDDITSRFEQTPVSGLVDSSFVPYAVRADGTVSVIVEMKGDPVAVVEAKSGRGLTPSEKAAIRKSLKKNQDSVGATVTAKGGSIVAEMQSAYNGLQVNVPASELDAISALPNVVAVHQAKTYTLENTVSVPFLGVPEVWEDTGFTGAGVKVAIIDTGIDYTHADFGGPGTPEAYAEAHADETGTADPDWYGESAPRVKGGIDLVGDAYNADDPTSVPMPDDNPLDCQGHGSHVAGTAAGSGVTAAGETYTGAYDAATVSGSDWNVGPGVAPEADLYAVRVFGCDGSTNVVVAAIDWAVEHEMDVINMSLGSPYGRATDPDAVAASNAVAAGVVVVASAGNEGPNPYLTGSPGVGEGVIAVAAVDSTAEFPGAQIHLPGDVTVDAINANDADLSGLGDLAVVRLVDDPATPENEALGCSVDAFTSNGVTAGGSQLAVATRGTCARVAKAIFGEQAGAGAVVMVNTADSFPPYEGEITSNPDDGTPFEVTIPFLGVKSSSGEALSAAVGGQATISAAMLPNPGFEGFASFSSGGPRSGDSGLSPNIAAPGVSISSAAVGTGSGSEILSGTSMAAPHVAGVAALTAQSHPDWDASQLSAAVVSTADPDGVAGQRITLGGAGLVDAAGAVATEVTATGDAFSTAAGDGSAASLSFGFQESSTSFGGTKTVTLTNHGDSDVEYAVSSTASAQSVPADVSFSAGTVVVPAGDTATVDVTVSADAADVDSAAAGGFAFSEVSGYVTFSAASGDLRVPYLAVPRALSDVSTDTATLFAKKSATTEDIDYANAAGGRLGTVDTYQWGLQDAQDLPAGDAGLDLRAAGVQSFQWNADNSEQLMVFAVNTWTRSSNAASNEYDIVIDTNHDKKADYVVFVVDYGLVTSGYADGDSGVFVYDVKTGGISVAFFATAPTDGSTTLVPVLTSQLGLTSKKGSFEYSLESYGVVNDSSDVMSGNAGFNPWTPALTNGDWLVLDGGGSDTVTVGKNASAFAQQKPLGLMAVVLDNPAGEAEAVLTPVR